MGTWWSCTAACPNYSYPVRAATRPPLGPHGSSNTSSSACLEQVSDCTYQKLHHLGRAVSDPITIQCETTNVGDGTRRPKWSLKSPYESFGISFGQLFLQRLRGKVDVLCELSLQALDLGQEDPLLLAVFELALFVCSFFCKFLATSGAKSCELLSALFLRSAKFPLCSSLCALSCKL